MVLSIYQNPDVGQVQTHAAGFIVLIGTKLHPHLSDLHNFFNILDKVKTVPTIQNLLLRPNK